MNRSRSHTWIEVLLPLLVILGLFAFALFYNLVLAFVVLFVGLAVWLTRFIQRHQPREPGE